MTRLLVCGGREFSNYPLLEKTLDGLFDPYGFIVLIEGGARGADHLANKWARVNNLPIETYPADWNTYGKSAGYIRNKQMLDEGKPDLVVAFPGGAGTAMMVKIAKEANVQVIEITS